MKKMLIVITFIGCLLLSSCTRQMNSNQSENEDVYSDTSKKESVSDNEPISSSKVLVPLGVISGKRPGGSVELPSEFVCTQPLSNCYKPKEGSDYFGITSITITLQDTRKPNEIILKYGTRSGIGSASFYDILQGNRKIKAYIIGEWDADDKTRLLQPKDRFYRHVLEFEEGPYFVSFVYTTKGIENKEAEEHMLSIIDTFKIESPIDEKIAATFDTWSNFGIEAPLLFKNAKELTVENLRKIYAYYCATTHTPVYSFDEEGGIWEAEEVYYSNNYAKADEICEFKETYFGKNDLSAEDLLKTGDIISPDMVGLGDYYSTHKKRPENWLNDVFLLDGQVKENRIILKLRYFYTRTVVMPNLESLDCTITAKWTENGPIFESCKITDTVSRASEPDFVRTEAQLSPEILSKVDPLYPTSIMDAFYLGLELEKQGYIVFQEVGGMAYTTHGQITDSGSKEVGIPYDIFDGYTSLSITRILADGNYRSYEHYLMSYDTGKIVSLNEEEFETMLRGEPKDKEALIKELFG